MEDKIKKIEEHLVKMEDMFEPDADWWDWGNADDAHAHGVDEGYIEGIKYALAFLKQE